PTASLPKADVEMLFEAIRRVRERGLGVLYVSHRLDEVFFVARQVTVLRDGRRVGTFDTAELSEDRLISMMIGVTPDQERKHLVREERRQFVETAEDRVAAMMLGEPARAVEETPVGPLPEAVLVVRGVQGDVVRGIDFDAHAGEVLGFAGLTGSGRDEVLPLLFGAAPRIGSVEVDGAKVSPANVRSAIKHRVSLVPANRHRQGLMLSMTVRENCTLTSFGHLTGLLGAIRAQRELAEVREWIARLDLRPPDPRRIMSSLSGGNQQ